MPPSSGGWGDEDDAEPSTRRAFVGALPGASFGVHGARPLLDGTGVAFRVWAPSRAAVDLVLYEPASHPPREARRIRMSRHDDGFHACTAPGARAGALYAYVLDGEGPFPDPASRFQPLGVHGPSQVVDPATFRWTDAQFRGCPLEDLVIYEVHVGTATREGTFRALIDRLDHVRALGATAIELMPIGDFPGQRGWGYDGVALFAPARCYGTPEDLAALVDAAHARGLAVLLDVVYNHLGPDGNYLRQFSPQYFTDRHATPWGDAVNYDGPGSDAVRAFVLENATAWIRDYHFDGLRLDAAHAIVDDGSGTHVLAAIAQIARAAASGREVVVIAEDERNEARLVRDAAHGGLGLDGVWADDFHHEVRRIVAGDDEAWFEDFAGTLDELVLILRRGWLYEGQPTKREGRPRGTPAFDVAPRRLVHCLQNHDQVGNRAEGDRLHHRIDLARYRAAVGLLLATPYTPLLFMGQELAASTPFAYFTDHQPELGRKVTEGRRAEFAKFRAFGDEALRHAIPDPQDPQTFERCKLRWDEAERSPGKEILALHRALLKLRREDPAMAGSSRTSMEVERLGDSLLAIRRSAGNGREALLFVVGLTAGGRATLGHTSVTSAGAGRTWTLALDTESAEHGGTTPASLAGNALVLHGPGAVVLRSTR